MATEEKELSLLPRQQQVLEQMQEFCKSKDKKVFILSGYAGTGKTTLLKAFTQWLADAGYVNVASYGRSLADTGRLKYVPMASTGRAAKVLSNKIGQRATTAHSWIYRFNGFNQDIEAFVKRGNKVNEKGQLLLDFCFYPLENSGNTIYIVDEASMVSDTKEKNPIQAVYGSGRLLCDLFKFDNEGKFVFVGDDCQLPPVSGTTSPALDANYIKDVFGFETQTVTLTEIVRQGAGNDIVCAAERMRKLCTNPPLAKWGRFPFKGYYNISIVGSQLELISRYVGAVKKGGYDAATMLTSSNRSCNILSSVLRKQLGFTDPRLMEGELLLIMQNNQPTGLMNGDLVKVISVGERQRTADLTFLSVEIEELVTHRVFSSLLIEELLYSNAPNLDQQQQQKLFVDFYYREKNKDIKQKSIQFVNDLKNDPFLNAVRASFGYAITCHKAQGGEWAEVFLDIPNYISHTPDRRTYQWLYTAMTRAKERLYVANNYFIV